MVCDFLLLATSRQLPHFRQHLHHREGVEFAVAEQRFLFVERHCRHTRVDSHRLAAVVYRAGQVVVVQRRIVGEKRRQHRLDGEAAAHRRIVAVALLEWREQVHNVVADAEQMLAQVGEVRRQFFQPAALKTLVVGHRAGIRGNVAAQLIGQHPARVVHAIAQKLAVL